jgi:hypothetical protein
MTTIRKAYRLYKFLCGFQIRIGLPHSWCFKIAKTIFPPAKGPDMKVESGWVRDSNRGGNE